MAAITYTFLDAKNGVYTLLHGQKFAETEGGKAAIEEAINRAQAEVPHLLGSLTFAGGLYQATAYSQSGTVDSFDISAGAWLSPLTAEVKDGASTYAQAGRAEPERILRMAKTGIASKEYLYAFLGNSVWVRPVIPSGGSVIVYGLKIPTKLTGDSDVLSADVRLFRAIVLRAAWIVIQKFPSEDGNRFDQIEKDMFSELQVLKEQVMELKKEEYEARTGRDLTFAGRASGQGG